MVRNQFDLQVRFEKKSVSLPAANALWKTSGWKIFTYTVLTLHAFINELKRTNQRGILPQVFGLKMVQFKYSLES